jgi:hypothetical protein
MASPGHISRSPSSRTAPQRGQRLAGGLFCLVAGGCLVVLSGKAGRAFTLPAPTDSERRNVQANPRFSEQLAVINS